MYVYRFNIEVSFEGGEQKLSPELVGVIGVIALVVLILFRVSVGFSLILVGFVGISYLKNVDVGLTQLATSSFATVNNYSLSVIPLFVLMGMFMSNTGLGFNLFNAVNKWIGHLRGGLAIATIGAATIFSSISGSANATTATLAKITIPEMERHKYKTDFSAAAVAAGGTLGSVIPPSVLLILYGALTSEPIGPLLIAGIIPGLLMALLLILMINFQVRFNPDLAPSNKEKITLKEKFSSLKTVWPFLLIFMVSIGGIYFGIFTPNEAGAVGAASAFLLAVITKKMSWKMLISSLDETLRISVMIFFVLIGASIFSRFLAMTKIPMTLSTTIGTLDLSPFAILFIILLFYFILGMFLESIAIMVLTLPIIYPIITQLGFDGLWFGVIMVLIINIGVLTPPLGLNVYIVSGVVKHLPIQRIFRAVVPSIITMFVCIVILTIFPDLVTFLPNITDQ